MDETDGGTDERTDGRNGQLHGRMDGWNGTKERRTCGVGRTDGADGMGRRDGTGWMNGLTQRTDDQTGGRKEGPNGTDETARTERDGTGRRTNRTDGRTDGRMD